MGSLGRGQGVSWALKGGVPNVSGQETDRRGLKGYSTGRRTLGEQAI